MSFAVCVVPVSPVRKEPAHRSEMVSQLLFGEFTEIISDEKDFVLVICLYDGYKGWCQKSQLEELDENELLEPAYFAGEFNNHIKINETAAYIPFGSPLYVIGDKNVSLGQCRIDYRNAENKVCDVRAFNPDHLKEISYEFLNTAYLWGGKSVYGIDCSGFAQQVFKFFGIKLLRDAYLQAAQGEEVMNLNVANAGDLAFFENDEGRITHVGILLNDKEIIHASGKVRIDKIDEEGIITAEGKRTHKLHSIKRMRS